MPPEILVVGAGPAGLACAAMLRGVGEPVILLEAAAEVGSSWRRHYDRLHLHTDRTRSALPGHPFPADAGRYPSRLAVVRYLESYVERFGLEPRFGQPVVSARPWRSGWEVATPAVTLRARHLVVATGQARVPVRPQWPGLAGFDGTVLHSSEYRNGEPFRGLEVLVVGFGNSAGEIALDLLEHGARPALAVRSPVNVIPREILGIPILALSKLTIRLPPRLADALTAPLRRVLQGDLEALGLRRQAYGPMTQIRRDGRIPLIDIGTMAAIRGGGIRVRPGIEGFDAGSVRFTDGRRERYDAVVLGTGYRPAVDEFLDAGDGAVDERGSPRTSGEEALPGLWFCGFRVSPIGMLRSIAAESRAIAAAIARGAGSAAAR